MVMKVSNKHDILKKVKVTFISSNNTSVVAFTVA